METVKEYIAALPKAQKAAVKQLREAILKAAPKAEERISYKIPAFFLNGRLVYYAAWKKHIAFYPASSSILRDFKTEVAPYAASVGTLHFPLDKPLPLALVKKLVKRRVEENLAKAKVKKGSRLTSGK